MTREETLERLWELPLLLRAVAAAVPEELRRRRSKDGMFAVVEHAQHLADLEEEGFGARIARLQSEVDPLLPDFRGDVIAERRRYLEQPLAPALDRFAAARTRNLEALARVADWSRAGRQENVGPVTLADLPGAMLAHDRGHAGELLALLGELGVAPPPALEAYGRPAS